MYRGSDGVPVKCIEVLMVYQLNWTSVHMEGWKPLVSHIKNAEADAELMATGHLLSVDTYRTSVVCWYLQDICCLLIPTGHLLSGRLIFPGLKAAELWVHKVNDTPGHWYSIWGSQTAEGQMVQKWWKLTSDPRSAVHCWYAPICVVLLYMCTCSIMQFMSCTTGCRL